MYTQPLREPQECVAAVVARFWILLESLNVTLTKELLRAAQLAWSEDVDPV